MIIQRKSSERGYTERNWLESWHSFSFADYQDPAHVHYASLRVINEDIVQPRSGFGMHPHRNMEILTYVLEGTLSHQDSMGNREQIGVGEVQVMSAGTGVTHSEINSSSSEVVHLLQIWIIPALDNLSPGYQQKAFGESDKLGRWCQLASPDRTFGSLCIHQDVRVFATLLNGSDMLNYPIAAERRIYLHVARGSINANGRDLQAGDALMYSNEENVELAEGVFAELLLFDMA